MLPIFCDHVLNPILSDESFLTEVHHVDGAGEDAGVVYCEMQGDENSGESLVRLSLVVRLVMLISHDSSQFCCQCASNDTNTKTNTNTNQIKSKRNETTLCSGDESCAPRDLRRAERVRLFERNRRQTGKLSLSPRVESIQKNIIFTANCFFVLDVVVVVVFFCAQC